MAGRDSLSGQLCPTLDRADAEPRQIIVAGRIHAGHFRCFAADQRAACLLAAIRDARDYPLRNAAFERSGGEIVEEEQRLRALHDQVVDAHGNQIDADGIVPVVIDRQLQLGADAIVRGDQQGVLEPGRLGIEESAESAELGVRPGPGGRAHQRADRLDQRIACRDRDTCAFVGVAFFWVGHCGPSYAFALGNPSPLGQKAREFPR